MTRFCTLATMLAASLACACSDNMTMNTTDMPASGGDMAQAPGDMAKAPPMLDLTTEGINCADATVTAAVLMGNTGVAKTKCATAGCHMNTSQPIFTDAASFKTMMMAKGAQTQMQRATAGDFNNSYLLYALIGQGGNVQPGGSASDMLADYVMDTPANRKIDFCMFYNWIKHNVQ